MIMVRGAQLALMIKSLLSVPEVRLKLTLLPCELKMLKSLLFVCNQQGARV